MSENKECMLCGELESDHHDFTPPPHGCVCEPDSWRDADNVPGVCMDFLVDPTDPARCLHCNHDHECHG
jgi:hypothetical protein